MPSRMAPSPCMRQGGFGGIAGQQDSVRLEIDILDSGRRLLSRSGKSAMLPRKTGNGQTGMLFDEISIVIPEGAIRY